MKIDGIEAREKEEVVCREADIIRIFMARMQDIKMGHINYNPEVQDEEILKENTQKPDLKIDQYKRFKENIGLNCINRRLKLQDMLIGPRCALEVRRIVRENSNISQLMLGKNCLGDFGVKIISNFFEMQSIAQCGGKMDIDRNMNIVENFNPIQTLQISKINSRLSLKDQTQRLSLKSVSMISLCSALSL